MITSFELAKFTIEAAKEEYGETIKISQEKSRAIEKVCSIIDNIGNQTEEIEFSLEVNDDRDFVIAMNCKELNINASEKESMKELLTLPDEVRVYPSYVHAEDDNADHLEKKIVLTIELVFPLGVEC